MNEDEAHTAVFVVAFKGIACSSNKINSQNSFYTILFFSILHVNAPYLSASECRRKKGGAQTRLVWAHFYHFLSKTTAIEDENILL